MTATFPVISHCFSQPLLRHSIINSPFFKFRYFSSNYKMENNKVIILAGATAVGKSQASMDLSKILNSEIVIADSVQIYKYLDIASTKPSLEDRQLVPHHLIDEYEPSFQLNAKIYCQRAVEKIKDILSRDKVPILVGGTTMWLDWLVHGIPDAPEVDPEVRAAVTKEIAPYRAAGNWEGALQLLHSLDSTKAEKLFPNDWYRLERYVEISKQGSKFSDEDESDLEKNTRPPRELLLKDFDLRCFFVMESRVDLYNMIDQRCLSLLKDGLFQEVAHLLKEGHLHPEYTVTKAIGYRQAIEYYCKPTDLISSEEHHFIEFLQKFSTSTRNYAQKQHKWYAKDDQFLFTLNKRKEDPTAQSHLLTELLHWISLPREEFEQTLKNQIEYNNYYKLHMSKKRLDPSYVPINEIDAHVFNKVKDIFENISPKDRKRAPNNPMNKSKKEAKVSIDQTLHSTLVEDHSQISWSALEINARSGDLTYRNAPNFFTSQLLVNNKLIKNDEIRQLFETAKSLREKLHKEVPELLKEFYQKFF